MQLSSLFSGGKQLKQQTFLGSGTWTHPNPGTDIIIASLIVVGGGGGGGGGHTTTYRGGGGGGGFILILENIVLTASQTVTIGAGGNGGGVSTHGTNGGSSSFGPYTANGGYAGLMGTSNSNGIGGNCGVYSASTGEGKGEGAGGEPPYDYCRFGSGGRGGGNYGGTMTIANQYKSYFHNPGGRYGWGGCSWGLGGYTSSSGNGQSAAPYTGGGGQGGQVNGSGGNGGSGISIVTWWE